MGAHPPKKVSTFFMRRGISDPVRRLQALCRPPILQLPLLVQPMHEVAIAARTLKEKDQPDTR
jgi:hypothetical protein